MKVYKDIDEVIKPTEVPRELWEYEKEMKKKPNFDKSKKGENRCCKNEKSKKAFKTNKRY